MNALDRALYCADTFLHDRNVRPRWSWRWLCNWHDRRVLRT